MSVTKRLEGRRIAVLVADGFEKVEVTVPRRAMQVAGAAVDVISLRHGRIRGVNLHEPASRIHVDKTVQEARAADYDALFIPGGFINPDLLRQSSEARAFVHAFADAGKPIASLCHGPWVLASADLLRGRTVTSWPGIRDDLVNAGATWLDEPVVTDRNLLTSRGPQDIVPFVGTLLDHFAGVPGTSINATSSAPQRDRPPSLVIKTMRWMPRPSLRGALAAFAVTLGLGVIWSRSAARSGTIDRCS